MSQAAIETGARPAQPSAMTWVTMFGFACGVLALLALVVVASLMPVDAEAGLAAARTFGVDVTPSDAMLRWSGLLIFLVVAFALLASSARHSSAQSAAMARRENGRGVPSGRR
jgi:hypothetical protein